MRQDPKIMSKVGMIGATERAKEQANRWLQLAADMKNDSKKDARLARHECKACFYTARWGGAATSIRPCMSCGSDVTYSSTATDVLCRPCAEKHFLCKHCGGDLEMRTRRKEWPTATKGEQQ